MALRPRRDGRLNPGGIDRERRRVDVDEDGLGSAVVDGRDGGDERERGGDHLVARLDAGGQERQVQGARSRAGSDGVAGVAVRGEERLELGNLAPEDELRAVEHS